jgi:putative redox protein
MCAALGACTAMTVRMYARRKGLALRRVRVCVGHARTRGDALPDGFTREVALEGDLTDEERSRLLEIAERCPVHASLKQGARVVTQAVGQITRLAGIEGAGQHMQDMTAA